MSQHLEAYKIVVVDFSRRKNHQRGDGTIRGTGASAAHGKGLYRCGRCHWEGESRERCPRCGGEVHQKGRIKVADMTPSPFRRTMVELFRSHKKAKKWGEKHGTVISCEKIDKSHYFENIEHLNFERGTVAIELEQDYVLTRTLELERPRRASSGKKYEVEIEGGIDKE